MQAIGSTGSAIEPEAKVSLKNRASSGIRHLGDGIGGILNKAKKSRTGTESSEDESDIFAKIEKLAKLRDMVRSPRRNLTRKKQSCLQKYDFFSMLIRSLSSQENEY